MERSRASKAAFIFLSFLAPCFAFAAPPATLADVIKIMTDVVLAYVPFMMVLLIFYWNISQIIFTSNNPEKRKQALPRLIWSIIAITVIFSLGGLINIISNTILGTSEPNFAPAGGSIQTTATPYV